MKKPPVLIMVGGPYHGRRWDYFGGKGVILAEYLSRGRFVWHHYAVRVVGERMYLAYERTEP